MVITRNRDRKALLDVFIEVTAARKKFPPMASPHEGWAVIKEEVDELWDEVKKHGSKRVPADLRKEAIQVAAMATRFVVDICGDKKARR